MILWNGENWQIAGKNTEEKNEKQHIFKSRNEKKNDSTKKIPEYVIKVIKGYKQDFSQ